MPLDIDIIESEVAVHSAIITDSNLFGSDFLRQSLQEAIDAESHIPDEIDKLTQIALETSDEGELEQIEYMKDLVGWQLTRAAETARIRMANLDEIETFGKQTKEEELNAKDIHHWHKYWAWTFDPRPDSPLAKVPFLPFKFQDDAIDWLLKRIFVYRKGGVIEKAREQGASWFVLDANAWMWKYIKGYQALFASRKEEYVDEVGNMKSLFEKLRFQLRMLPDWQIPKGVDVSHLPFAKLVNPENDALLDGESSNQNVGRGGRYTAAFLDEFQAFPGGGNSAMQALTDATRSIFMIGTAHGTDNRFYTERTSGRYEVLSLTYDLHPWKDERWLKWQKRIRPANEFAQEVLIDYTASVSGRLFSEFNPLVHFITWEEFVAFFKSHNVPDVEDLNRFPRIPPHWTLARGLDIGTNEQHPTCSSMAAAPAVGEPLQDCVFVFSSLVLDGAEEAVTPLRIHNKIYSYCSLHNLHNDRFAVSVMSHEAKTERDSFILDVQPGTELTYDAWDGSRVDGIGAIQNYLQERNGKNGLPIVPHPFRPYLSDPSIPEGKRHYAPRIFFICKSPQGVAYFDEATQRWMARPSVDEDGHARVAYEFPKYHTPEEGEGDRGAANPLAPVRKKNDMIDSIRMYAHYWFVPNTPLTEAQLLESALPKNLRKTAMKGITDPEELAGMIMARESYIKRRNIVTDTTKSWRQQLYEKLGNG